MAFMKASFRLVDFLRFCYGKPPQTSDFFEKTNADISNLITFQRFFLEFQTLRS